MGMAEQSLLAMDEADIVLFIVDCRSGIIAADYMIAEKLRQKNRKVYLVANKIDGLDPALRRWRIFTSWVFPECFPPQPPMVAALSR